MPEDESGTTLRDQLARNLGSVHRRMALALERSGRLPGEVRLVAVTKRAPIEWVRPLVELGARDLGENYPQELWKKAGALADLAPSWHLIGHLQGNKAKRTLPLVRMIHSVDSLRLLDTLNEAALGVSDPPQALIQVNTSAEPSKHGWSPEAVLADADRLAAQRSIAIVGLMTMAPIDCEGDRARPYFARLREIRDTLRSRTGLALPELSMGMSGDFEAAIAEGATLVRVGSALFEGLKER